jgi:hypothetical protein
MSILPKQVMCLPLFMTETICAGVKRNISAADTWETLWARSDSGEND